MAWNPRNEIWYEVTFKYITSNITFIHIPHSPSGQTQALRRRSWAGTPGNPHCLHHCPVPTLKKNTVLRFQVTNKKFCVSDICFKLWTEKNNEYDYQDSDLSSYYGKNSHQSQMRKKTINYDGYASKNEIW